MKPRRVVFVLTVCLFSVAVSRADDRSSGLTDQHRMELIRTFNSDLVYIRTQFPMGKTGLTLKEGKLSPSGDDLNHLLALWGPSVKPGDRALITKFEIRGDRMRFEINGGPTKKQKWYQHIQVGMNGNMNTPGGDQNAPTNNPRGSYVDLVFDHHIPDLTAEQLKQMLWPVFDFNSKSPVDAYLETCPPLVKEAIKNHHVLVGMNREMVIYSKGRPAKKDRERDDQGTEYEEWIYGEPPQDVDFVRLVGDEVVRVETMKVNGQKTVRTEKEIELAPKPTLAQTADQPRPANAPSLRRPGEELPSDVPNNSAPKPVMSGPPPPPQAPGGNPPSGPN